MNVLIQFERSVQITEDSWRVKRISKVVSENTQLIDILKWAIRANEMKMPDKLEILQISEL